MKQYIKTLSCFLFVIFTAGLHSDPHKTSITYSFSGGRFGDNLMAYLHAKWLSHKYGISLVYKPFPFSNQLVLDEKEKRFGYKEYRRHIDILLLKEEDLATPSCNRPCLFTCPYFPEDPWERQVSWKGQFSCQVDWEDQEFRDQLRLLVAPKAPLALVTPPGDKISVAVHYRKGSGGDSSLEFSCFLTKFPPLDFYIENLQKVMDLFPNREIYCFLFTDAKNPEEIIATIHSQLGCNPLITLDSRNSLQSVENGVLEDFFSLFHFDILIHSQSNFSLIPSLIHDYAITCSPISAHLEEGVVKIDKTQIKIRENLCNALLKRSVNSL